MHVSLIQCVGFPKSVAYLIYVIKISARHYFRRAQTVCKTDMIYGYLNKFANVFLAIYTIKNAISQKFSNRNKSCKLWLDLWLRATPFMCLLSACRKSPTIEIFVNVEFKSRLGGYINSVSSSDGHLINHNEYNYPSH